MASGTGDTIIFPRRQLYQASVRTKRNWTCCFSNLECAGEFVCGQIDLTPDTYCDTFKRVKQYACEVKSVNFVKIPFLSTMYYSALYDYCNFPLLTSVLYHEYFNFQGEIVEKVICAIASACWVRAQETCVLYTRFAN